MVPKRIEGYRIVRELGSGGMGTVFEAVHVELSRRVAIKLVRPEHARDPEIEARFLNEARALARVAHPSIVQIYTFGVLEDGASYLIMEYLEGESLAQRWQRLRAGADLLPELRLIHQVASVLAILHRYGVVHRDIKPENIMTVPDPVSLGQKRAKLVDFGLAKLLRFSGIKSASGLVMGTPIYMSPEQCRGSGQTDAKTDCYSFGVMLYELLTGRPPFDSPWAGDLIGMHLHVEPPPLEAAAPGIDGGLAALAHALLTKDAAHRPAMGDVAEQLGELIRQLEQPGAAPRSARGSPCDVLAPTLPRAPLLVSQAEPSAGPMQGLEEPPEVPVAPSQSGLDSVFAKATQAHLFDGGIHQGEPLAPRALLTLKTDGLRALQATLRLREDSPLRRCSCLGDLTIELRSPTARVALLSYHHHEVGLLGISGWDRDAELIEADALLHLLARYGVTEPGKKLFAEKKIKAEGRREPAQRWLNGPRPQPVLSEPPAALLLDEQAMLALLTSAQTEPKLRAAVDLLSGQELQSTSAWVLPHVPESAWERLLTYARAHSPKGKPRLVEHAQRAARAQQELNLHARRMEELTLIAQSEQGPLQNLVTDGVELISVVRETLVRIAPRDGTFSTIMALPGSDIELSCCGPSLLLCCASAGIVGRVHIVEARLEVLMSDRPSPRMPLHCGWNAHWVEPFEGSASLAALVQYRERTAWEEGAGINLSLLSRGSPGAAADSQLLCFLDQTSGAQTQLRWLGANGLHYQAVPSTARLTPGLGSPVLALSATHAFWPDGNKVLSARKLGTDTALRATASGPIAAIVPAAQGLYVLVGSAEQRIWHVEFAATGQTVTCPLGRFRRRPADPVAAVALGGRLFIASGSQLFCVSDPTPAGVESLLP